jgi:hypothetical protein
MQGTDFLQHTSRRDMDTSPHDLTNKKLYVIAVVSNPARFTSRYTLFHKFKEYMSKNPNVELYIVEQAFGQRPFEVTHAGNPKHIQVRSYDELWHKENMINLGIQRLPADWEYMAWIDADVEFVRPDWAQETIHQLQHHQVVQMFQHAIDLGPTGESLQIHQGFLYSHFTDKPKPEKGKYAHWHPGYAWAARREAIDALGGLYDVSVLGSGDHLMAWALLGQGASSLPSQMTQSYKDTLADWERRATRFIHRDVGYVKGTLLHYWHGKKSDRRYTDRWKILRDAQFDPTTDLKKDWQGLWQLDMDGSDRLIQLRDGIRKYFRARNEDSTDLE